MEVGRNPGKIANEHITIDSNSHEKVKNLEYSYLYLTTRDSIREKIKYELKAGNSCYYSH